MISFDSDNLGDFTEWKMMGERDYVLGLEPGNCHPDGRRKMREDGTLKILAPKEETAYRIRINMVRGMEAWERECSPQAEK